MSLKNENLEIQKNNQNELRKLEEFYTDGKVEDMLETIDSRKEKMIKDMIEYHDKQLKESKWDRDGKPVEWKVDIKPIVINNYFFKPITPIASQEPIYNAEKLGMVYDYYCEILANVNNYIGDYPSSLTNFCKFAGITLNTLRQYKNSNDINMRTIANKIYDQVGDENITMSQLGYVKERSTMFKMKSENEMVEKQQPKVNINIVEKPDMEKIEARINKYRQFANKKNK
jgi:hypothetical protein